MRSSKVNMKQNTVYYNCIVVISFKKNSFSIKTYTPILYLYLYKNIFKQLDHQDLETNHFTKTPKVAFFFFPLCSFLSEAICRNANKTAMSSSRVTSAAAARRKRWQQHAALNGMSTEMQLRPLTAYCFWRSVRCGKSFNIPDFKYFSNLPNHIWFSKWRPLMFKQSIRTKEGSGEL